MCNYWSDHKMKAMAGHVTKIVLLTKSDEPVIAELRFFHTMYPLPGFFADRLLAMIDLLINDLLIVQSRSCLDDHDLLM